MAMRSRFFSRWFGVCAFLALIVSAKADTWYVPSTTFAVTLPAGHTGSGFWIMYGGSNPNATPRAFISQGSSGVYSSAVQWDRSFSVNVGPATSSQPFHFIAGWKEGGVYNFTHWKNAANVTNDPNATGNSGGFNSSGNATGSNGLPVDANGNNTPTETNNRYDKEIILENDTDGVKTFRITTKDADGNIISEKILTLGPGQKVPWKMSSNNPFAYYVDEASTVDGGETAWDNIEAGAAVGSTPSQNGNAATPTGPSSGQGGSVAPTETPDLPPVPDQSRPGTSPDPNAENRHKELRGELQRIASQTKDAMDKAHTDAVADSTLQRTMKDSLKAIESAIGGTGGASSGSGSSGTVPTEVTSDGTAQSTGTKDGFVLIKGDLVALQSKISGVIPSNAELAWSIEFPWAGTRVISLEGFSSHIAAIRNFILYFLAYKAVMDIISVARGAFAEEGKI